MRASPPIEISFVTTGQLYPWTHPCPYEFHYSEYWREKFKSALKAGKFHEVLNGGQKVDPDLAAHIMVTIHRGITLFGEGISKTFPQIPKEDYLDAVINDLNGSYEEKVDQQSTYTLLNHLRTLSYLQDGQIRSKEEGGRWGVDHMPVEYRYIAGRALEAYMRGEERVVAQNTVHPFIVFVRSRIQSKLNDNTLI